MTTEQKVQVIAEYDGWKDTDRQKRIGSEQTGGEWYVKDGAGRWLDMMPYLTDLNALHKVAMDVMEELSKCRKEHHQFHIGEIRYDMFSRPINGEYIDLFTAVYDGIEFLNQHK